MCVISFSGLANNVNIKNLNELIQIMNKGINQHIKPEQAISQIYSCSNRGNTYCSALYGYQLYKTKDYASSYPLLISNAQLFKDVHLDIYASLESAIAHMLTDGLGVNKNIEQGQKHYENCALTGNEFCAYNMANIYLARSGTKANNYRDTQWDNYVRSYSWLKIDKKLGNKYIIMGNSDKQDISEVLTTMQLLMGEERMKTGDKLSDEICAKIPNCVQ